MATNYQEFFEHLPHVCVVLSPDFRVFAVNRAFERASMRSRDTVIGQVLYEAFPDNPSNPSADGVNNLRASLEHVRREKTAHRMPVQRYDVEDPDRPGVFLERYWHQTNSPVLDERGELKYILHSVEEMTEIVRLEQAQLEKDRAAEAALRDEHRRLAEANIALEAANEELEAFCYSVAHDLRAPLRGIHGFSQALVEDYSASIDEKGQQYLQRVAAAAVRMSELIDDLLTLSRISRAPLMRAPVDLSAMAQTIASELGHQSGRPVAVAIGQGITANADARLMQIALENLLNNAWKFSGKTPKPRVEFGLEMIDGAKAMFVRDNGAGFDEAYASKLFAPFQRLHSEKDFPGTGIGLAIVQRVVRRHGGRVWARAAVDEGATFYFTLPDP
jgi:signal transduction histidine kinase